MGTLLSYLSCDTCYCDPSCRSCKVGKYIYSKNVKDVASIFKFSYTRSYDVDMSYTIYEQATSKHRTVIFDRFISSYYTLPTNYHFDYIVQDLEKNEYMAFITRDRPLFIIRREFGTDSAVCEKTNGGDTVYIDFITSYLPGDPVCLE